MSSAIRTSSQIRRDAGSAVDPDLNVAQLAVGEADVQAAPVMLTFDEPCLVDQVVQLAPVP